MMLIPMAALAILAMQPQTLHVAQAQVKEIPKIADPANGSEDAAPKLKEPVVPETEPFDLRLAPMVPAQMICQPRTAQCISCTDTDPCYIYQGARRAKTK
jgi:hypothetical protein